MFTLGKREFLVGLGSNAPNAAPLLRRARRALADQPDWSLLRTSAIYSSDALLPENAPREWDLPFLNAACLIRAESDLEATAILARLQSIERTLGRAPAPRWAPRLIDLDLLAWGRPDLLGAEIQVPHPGLLDRPFAVLPALDCAPAPTLPLPARSWRYADASEAPFRTQVAPIAWAELVGIVNLTPDSFSGGLLGTPPEALEAQVRAQVSGGATVIDVGAESTRPNASPVPPDEEWRRLAPALPTLERLRSELGFTLSLDSRHATTVARALEACPIDWINDVCGFSDPEMLDLAKRTDCSLVFMHSLRVPPEAGHTIPVDADPVASLTAWTQSRIRSLLDRGIPSERLIFDPGIGFGKTPTQNLEILRRASELATPGVRLLLGHSRKRFLDPWNSVPATDRDVETAIVSALLARSRVDYLRVHMPEPQSRALRLGMRLG